MDTHSADAEIRPFRIEVPQADLVGLRDRLARTRWPGAEEDHRGELRSHLGGEQPFGTASRPETRGKEVLRGQLAA
jgi:hypothetical protein